jgi:hypothetical protein
MIPPTEEMQTAPDTSQPNTSQTNTSQQTNSSPPIPALTSAQIEAILEHLIKQRPDELTSYLANYPQLKARFSSFANTPTPTAAPAAPLTNDVPVSRPAKAKQPKNFSGNRSTYNVWKFCIRLFMKVTMTPAEIETPYGVSVVGTYMEGRAMNWYMANADTLSTPSQLFVKYEQDHDIIDEVEISCTQIEAFCSQPWTGTFEEFCEIFEPLAAWAGKVMGDRELLQHFLFPQPQYIKEFYALPIHPASMNWKAAKALISKWLNRKDSINRKPGTQLLKQMQAQTSGPVAMEVGAVTTPSRPSNTNGRSSNNNKPSDAASSRRLSPAEYWKDKTCDACGQHGHGRNYKGCPKHPEHRSIKPRTRTYAAAVTQDDHHSPVAATATAPVDGASTSAAAQTTAPTGRASTPANPVMQAQLDNIQAMLTALMSSNC